MAESEEELKNLLMRVKEESEKASLKLNSQKTNHAIWSHHFMANRWGNNGEFYFLGLQNHSSDCSHEIKVCHFPIVSPFICHEVMGPDAMILVF